MLRWTLYLYQPTKQPPRISTAITLKVSRCSMITGRRTAAFETRRSVVLICWLNPLRLPWLAGPEGWGVWLQPPRLTGVPPWYKHEIQVMISGSRNERTIYRVAKVLDASNIRPASIMSVFFFRVSYSCWFSLTPGALYLLFVPSVSFPVWSLALDRHLTYTFS